jgi:hypothetical protein
MRFYPAAPRPRRVTLALDALVLATLLLFAKLGLEVHDAVDELSEIGRGVEAAGGSVQRALTQAADGVQGVPLVGGELADQLRRAGATASGEALTAGREGQERVHELARTLGWLTFVIPAVLVIAQYAPPRIGQVRRLTAAAQLMPAGSAHPQLLAMRAAFSLPYPDLLRHTSDPFGDLERGEYDGLVAAALEDAGLPAATAR